MSYLQAPTSLGIKAESERLLSDQILYLIHLDLPPRPRKTGATRPDGDTIFCLLRFSASLEPKIYSMFFFLFCLISSLKCVLGMGDASLSAFSLYSSCACSLNPSYPPFRGRRGMNRSFVIDFFSFFSGPGRSAAGGEVTQGLDHPPG